jgi:hypothetical protein
MPTVPKLDPSQTQGDPGLLSDQAPGTRPDASSVLMASSLMANMGRLGHGAGESLRAPKRQKGAKGAAGKGILR